MKTQIRTHIESFFSKLARPSGGFAERPNDAEAELWSTVSAVKCLSMIGLRVPNPAAVQSYLRQCRDESGGYGPRPATKATPTHTGLALIGLHALGKLQREERTDAAIDFLVRETLSIDERYMMMAAYMEAAELGAPPAEHLQWLWARLDHGDLDHTDEVKVVTALLRAGEPVPPERLAPLVAKLLSDRIDGHWRAVTGISDETWSYLVSRLLTLATPAFDHSPVASFAEACLARGAVSASQAYQLASLLDWSDQSITRLIAAARGGDISYLSEWLRLDGDPDVQDREGWTPLLAAASRGRAKAVSLLLNPPIGRAANPGLRFAEADALPIYMAGQAGDIETISVLLARSPEHLHAFSHVNGHTVLLQCAFFGKPPHQDTLRWLLTAGVDQVNPGASRQTLDADQHRLLAATNVRGYTARRMNDELYNNQAVVALLDNFPQPSDDEVAAHYRNLLLSIASPERRATLLNEAIDLALLEARNTIEATAAASGWLAEHLAPIDRILADDFDVNHQGGPLGQPPLVFAVTGIDIQPHVAGLRIAIVDRLLRRGANPAVCERHPMGIGAVIRAAVLGRFDLLRLLAKNMSPEDFAREMNVRPAVNGLTALHDTVHRSLTADEKRFPIYREQLIFMLECGARSDLADHTGQTQRDIATSALGDNTLAKGRGSEVLAILEARSSLPQSLRT